MIVKQDSVFVRRRRLAAVALAAALGLGALGLSNLFAGPSAPPPSALRTASAIAADPVGDRPSAGRQTPDGKGATTPRPSPTDAQGRAAPSAQTRLVPILHLTGNLSAKSVVASGHGQVFAQNMMYQHTMTAFSADGARLATIPDAVDLAAYGVAGHAGTSKGAPVEAAFSPDGRTAWVSNYSMYGKGFLPEGHDACTGPGGASRSYLYAVDTRSYAVRAVVEVGTVPKYVAVTPDGKQVLVTNWCSMDLTVVDAARAEVVATIPVGGAHPRGIAVSPDSRTAYVAVMGSDRIVSVDLRTRAVRIFAHTGDGPRHIVISPDGRVLYVTNNGSGTVSEVDRVSGRVLRSVKVGAQPRSMAVSSDGGALYVVNYASSTMTKIRSSDLKILQTVRTDALPIGITYEPTRRAVWVSAYSGSVTVFDDSRLAPAT